MSGMSAFWSSIGLGGTSSKSEKAKAAAEADLKYIYSAFTKIPCLRLSPDHRARLIRGYEEFPFDTAVPLYAFKNVSALEVVDVDFRQFFGWDRLAEQLVWLTVKRARLENVADLLTGIVLDDADKRRRRSTKANSSPTIAWVVPHRNDLPRSNSDPGSPVESKFEGHSPQSGSPGKELEFVAGSPGTRPPTGNMSPGRPLSRASTSYRHMRTNSRKIQRSGSGSSNGSETSAPISGGSSNLLAVSILPATKWRFLKYLSFADNSLTSITADSLLPVSATLRSLDLSSNLFAEIPESLACLTALRSLDLSNCMIESLHSLSRSPLPAVTVLKLRSNRLRSLAGIERLLSLERLDLSDNKITDPEEAARLTGLPNLREIWVKHNPFTRTHSNYRVTVFNLFRKTPGYIEDVVIDNSGPGYAEKKQLVERVAELERPPVVRKVEVEDAATPVIVQSTVRHIRAEQSRPEGQRSEQVVLEVQRPQLQTIVTDPTAVSSTRRKRSTRRRIVDLSKENSTRNKAPSYMLSTSIEEPTTPTSPPRELNRGTSDSHKPLSPKPDDSSRSHILSSPTGSHRGLEWNLNEDDYRRKIAVLKQEMGNSWLSVLGDHDWDNAQDNRAHTGPGLPPIIPPIPRANSQAIVSGARTLG